MQKKFPAHAKEIPCFALQQNCYEAIVIMPFSPKKTASGQFKK